jgi:hypothetical protein
MEGFLAALNKGQSNADTPDSYLIKRKFSEMGQSSGSDSYEEMNKPQDEVVENLQKQLKGMVKQLNKFKD